MWEIWAIYRIYLILPPGGIVGEKPPTVGELGIYKNMKRLTVSNVHVNTYVMHCDAY